MNKNKLILGVFLTITTILFSGCGASSSSANNSKEKVGGSTESSEMGGMVTIGSQVWTSKNLDVDSFRNGDPIPYAKTDEEWKIATVNQLPAYCYYNTNPASGEKYNKLYNWYALHDQRRLVPNGYHIPSNAEWFQLIDYLGGKSIAGTKMKSASGWKDNGNGTNNSGFLGLPVGFRDFGGEYFLIGKAGHWWSSTEYDSDSRAAIGCLVSYMDGNVDMGPLPKGAGLSVRCIRD